MRVLLTGMPVYSHLVPMLVPVAKALRAAGHEVVVATGRRRRPSWSGTASDTDCCPGCCWASSSVPIRSWRRRSA
ncbi:MAG TPA: hypothetical protein VGD48_28320 [Kutzneria sp.]